MLRSSLKIAVNYKRVFINEELTKKRGEVFFNEIFNLVKDNSVNGTWTSNGIILMKDNRDVVHRCESMDDLAKLKRIP